MKKIYIILVLFTLIGNVVYSFDANDLTARLYSKAKEESLAQRLKKEKHIELEEEGEVINEPNKRDDQMLEKAQIEAAKKIAKQLVGAKLNSRTTLTENNCETITNKASTYTSSSNTQSEDTIEINNINFHSITLVPNSIRRTQKYFSAKFKFVLFYNKSLQILELKTDSILYAMQDTILNGLENELGSYKNDFFVLHYSDNYKTKAGYELFVSKASGSYKDRSRRTNYDVILEVTIKNNNIGFENESKSFIGHGSSKKKVKGLVGGILQPVTSNLFNSNEEGSSLTGKHSTDLENSSYILGLGRNAEGFREAVAAAIKDVCTQIHVYVNQ